MKLEKIEVAAAFLGVEVDTLYRWCACGYAPCIRLGRGASRRLLRFNMDRLRQWAESKDHAQPGRGSVCRTSGSPPNAEAPGHL